MQHGNRINFVLAILLIVLGLLAWLRPGTAPPVSSFNLLDLELDAIKVIKAEKKGEPVYTLEQSVDGWQLTAPFNAEADPAAIGQLVNKTRLRSADRYDVDEVDLEELGLGAPFMTFTFDDQVLLVGNSEPISQRRYVRLGDYVYLVSGLSIFSLDREARSFVLEPPIELESVEQD